MINPKLKLIDKDDRADVALLSITNNNITEIDNQLSITNNNITEIDNRLSSVETLTAEKLNPDLTFSKGYVIIPLSSNFTIPYNGICVISVSNLGHTLYVNGVAISKRVSSLFEYTISLKKDDIVKCVIDSGSTVHLTYFRS